MSKTSGAISVLRAAIASFGVVFIHSSDRRWKWPDLALPRQRCTAPGWCGAGAVHLADFGDHHQQQQGACRLRPGPGAFFPAPDAKFAERYAFGAEYDCEDGARTNFCFDADDEAIPVWRYPDLTYQAEYLGHVIRMTIESEMSK